MIIRIAVTLLWLLTVALGIRHLVRLRGQGAGAAPVLKALAYEAIGLLAPVLVWADFLVDLFVKQLTLLGLLGVATLLWATGRFLERHSLEDAG